MNAANRTANAVSTDTIHMTCPVCNAESFKSRTYEIEWTSHGLAIGRERFVRCEFCEKESMLVGFSGDISSASPEELSRHLVPPASPRDRLRAVLALASFWIPFLGFWIAWNGFRRLRHTHGVSKPAAIAALCMSSLISGSMLLALIIIPIALYFEFG